MDPRLRTWRWRVFAATWLSYFGFYFCRKPFYIAKASLQDVHGWNPEMLGLIGSVFLVAYALGQFLAGALGHRLGPRVLLLAGMLASAACNAAFGAANSWATFSLFMGLNGLAQATGWSGNVGAMAAWFHRRERGTVMGVWATNYQAGGVAANALAAWLLGAMGLRWSFFGGSIVLLAVWAFFLFNQRNRPEDLGLPAVREPGDREAAPAEAGERWNAEVWTNVLLVGLFYFFVKFIRYALWSWAPYLLQRSYGLAGDQAGYLSTVFDLAGIAGVIVAGLLSDRVFRGGRAIVSLIFIGGMAASCLALYLLGPHSLPVFSVCMALVGFTLYGPDALMSGAGAIDVGSRRGATLAAGIINGMGAVGSVFQELLLGRMLGQGAGTSAVFGLLLGSAVLAALALVAMLWRVRSGKARL